MIRFGEREVRGEDVEGALDLWVSDGCQRTRRVNENTLEGSISSLLLLESNWQLSAFRAARGLRFMLNLPSHPPQDFEQPERGMFRARIRRHITSVVSSGHLPGHEA